MADCWFRVQGLGLRVQGILGLCRDDGNKMETTIVYWGYIGFKVGMTALFVILPQQ